MKTEECIIYIKSMNPQTNKEEFFSLKDEN